MVADAVFRVSYMEQSIADTDPPMVGVNMISHFLPARPAKLDEIQKSMENDPVLSKPLRCGIPQLGRST